MRWMAVVGILFALGCDKPAAQSGAAKPFRVAMILPGSDQDHGWNQMAREGLDRIKTELKADTKIVTNVKTGEMANQLSYFGGEGFDVVICHGQEFASAVLGRNINHSPEVDVRNFGTAVPRAQGNWAPRVGFALSPGERKHMFRGAYGLFYGSTPALVPAQVSRYTELFISNDFQAPRVHQASVGWEVEKYRAGSLGIDYLFARGERLPRVVNVNATAPPLRRSYRYIAFQSTAESIYNGVTLHARARVDEHWRRDRHFRRDREQIIVAFETDVHLVNRRRIEHPKRRRRTACGAIRNVCLMQ